jgi:hypothetical protein
MSLGLAALVMLASVSGDALPGVVLLAPDDEVKASSFVENMRIQLTGMASVTLGPAAASGSPEERAERARLYLDSTGASIAVWKELRRAARTGALQIVVLAVTRDATRRPIEVARVDATRGEEAERVLALKVGELLYRVLATASTEQELAAALEKNEAEVPRPQPPPAQPSPVAPPPRLRLRALFEGGVGLRADSGLTAPQVAVRGVLGGALQKGDLRLELALGARRFTELQLRAANGSLLLREVGAGGEVRALKLLPPFALGAHLSLTADILDAAATTPDGRQGSATKVGSSLSAGPDLRLAVFPALEMRTRVAIETTLYDQRFAIEGIEVEGGASPRLSGELSLIYWIP